MKKLLFIPAMIIGLASVNAQDWLDLIDQGANFYDIKDAARTHFEIQQGPKVPGYKQYQRWEYFMEKRLAPSGEWPEDGIVGKEIKKLGNTSANLRHSTFPLWQSKGPNNHLNLNGLGRLNFIRFHPSDTNIIYVGSPSGGLWKSYDAGNTFIVLNDTLPAIGCADMVIDPINDSTLYLATGDRVPTGSSTNTDGIWKSTDGGYSWTQTGLAFPVSQNRKIGRLAINHLNPDVVFAASTSGIQKTTDGGATWNQVQSGSFNDIKYMPGDTSHMYASGSTYYRSTDGGETWTQKSVASGIRKFEMAVTPANPAKVLIVGCNSSNSGLTGIYESLDTGNTFTQIHGGSPNILGYDPLGNSTGGISWYCMAISISPTDEDLVFVGGVNVWKSTDGGNNFSISSFYQSNAGYEYAHADCHYLTFAPDGSRAYAGNDGGIYRSDDLGTTWTDISSPLVITQSYRMGLGQQLTDNLLMGNQDNGTNLLDGGLGYFNVLGADGMECLIGHTDPNLMYGSYQNGPLLRSVNGGASFSSSVSPSSFPNESSQWVTTFVMDPYQESVLYIGYRNIYKTSSSGIGWNKINDNSFPSGGNVSAMDISKWNPDKLIASKSANVFQSEDGGITWDRISNFTWSSNVNYIKYDNTDLSGNTIWVVVGGYSSTQKVFKTTDNGTTWLNESDGLPNVNTECVLIDDEGGSGGVYVGNEIGVFYKSDTMSEFVPYMNGLPNVIVTEMEIHYSTKKIVAVTYGRGVWEVDLLVTGLETYSKKGDLELLAWPNPSNGEINLRTKGAKGEGEISILDNRGSEIFTQNYSQSELDSDLRINLLNNNLSPGIYFLRFRSGNYQISEKLIIN